MEDCLICLETPDTNQCNVDVCLTCRKAFCKNCLKPDNLDMLTDCPHCKTPFITTFEEDIERCLKFIEKDPESIYISKIYFILYRLYNKLEDKENSLKYLKLAYENKCSCAFNEIAENYYEKGEYEEFKKYNKLAFDLGCLNSIIGMADIKMEEKKYQEAKELLLLACHKNLIHAQLRLSYLIYNKTIEGTIDEAIYWLQKAADKNSTEACFILSNIYYDRNQEGDYILAITYIKKAAINGHKLAQYNYAVSLFNEKAFYAAIKWFRRSYNQGYEVAIVKLAFSYMCMTEEMGDFLYYKGLEILEEAVEKNIPHAIFELANLYYTGNFYIKRDDEKAYTYMKKAADLNYPPAYFILSNMYEKGIGVEKSATQASEYAYMFLSHSQETA